MKTQHLEDKLDYLINQLEGNDGFQRDKARTQLMKIGKQAVPRLIKLLIHKRHLLRWEACRALAGIKDPSATTPLVLSLDDETHEVRWVAAEALIALKGKALQPLLEALIKNYDSVYLRQGAHHILHALERARLLNKETTAVLNAIRFIEPRISVAIAARKALNSLDKYE